MLLKKIDLNSNFNYYSQKESQKTGVSFKDYLNNIEKETTKTVDNTTSFSIKRIEEIGIYNYAMELHKKDLEKYYHQEVLEELGLTEETFKKLCDDDRIPDKLLKNLKIEIKEEVERRVEEQIKKEMLLSLSAKNTEKNKSTKSGGDEKIETKMDSIRKLYNEILTYIKKNNLD